MLVVMEDGTLGALTVFRTEQVTAWTRIDTTGTIHSVAVVGDDVYLLVQRPEGFSTRWNIERLDDALHLDAGLYGESETPVSVWSGLDHLNGKTVAVVADGVLRPDVDRVGRVGHARSCRPPRSRPGCRSPMSSNRCRPIR